MSNDYYHHDAIAAAYDTDIAGEAVTVDDIPFYAGLAAEAHRAGQSVLELGCGTGRVTIPMAATGASVVGIDSSAEMLAVAASKASGVANLRWMQGDMAAFELQERFGLVTIPFRSFLLLLTVEAQKLCLRCAFEHLLPGGRLALNFFNPNLVLMASWMTEKSDTWQRERVVGKQRDLLSKRRVRTAEQRVEGEDSYVDLSDEGAVVARVERNLRLRYVFRYEMEHLLALTGFEVEALYGWFDRRPFDDASSEMVWVARRPSR